MNGTYVSLFAGIGGLDLAVEALGYRCVGQVEWDKHCTAVLERWWPDVPRWGDIADFYLASWLRTTADTKGQRRSGQVESRSDLEYDGLQSALVGPDLIVGGFPCQPHSTAGRRKGTDDDRWLWPEFARVIGELRPRHVLVENVPGLLTVNGGRAFSEVVGTLADLGYDATWTSVRASEVGAPHKRERIFLLAYASGGSGPAAAVLRAGHGAVDDGRLPDGDNCAAALTDSERQGRQTPLRPQGVTGLRQEYPGAEPGGADPRGFAWGPYRPAIERWERVMGPAPHPLDEAGRLSPVFVGWMQGFPQGWTDGMSRTQALKALGNAVVPQQAILALSVLTQGVAA